VIALVLLAGAAGAVLRFFTLRLVRAPWAVLVVNVAGSFIGGLLIGATTGDVRLILLTGFCGGLTTFSTFSVETVQLVMERRVRTAMLSVAANLVLGIAAAAIGYAVTGLLAGAN
jgi:CrcB protein